MQNALGTNRVDEQPVCQNVNASYSEFSPQFAGSVYFSFPPPPCAPSPLDTQHIMSGMPMQIPIHSSGDLQPEMGGDPQIRSGAGNENIIQISDTIANTLRIEDTVIDNTEQNIQNGTIENANIVENQVPPPYSVILPPGSFVQHLGGNVPPQVYHQFSPALPNAISQFHPIYPINVVSSRDPMHPNSRFIQVRQPTAVDCANQNMQNQPTANVPVCTPNIPEAPWSNCPTGIPTNPPFYWGHYLAATDKGHGMTLASQSFMRSHSICDDSAVVTPTNVCPPCNLAGIVSATPEFIHPRKPDVPQWLMSPPVGEQDPSIISYAPMVYHNVRVPSVAGIAIPVVGPVGTAVPVGNTSINSMEPPKIDSPALLVSPVPFYENSPMPSQQQSNTLEVAQESGGCDVFCDPSMQSNALPFNPPINVMKPDQTTGPPLFKRVAELQQQPQCWQCVVTDKTPEVKHPTPDLYNRWPNIPPPPPPPVEDDDCQSVCSSNQMVADALPLAAALFHNEPTECCQNNNQDEEQQIPQTYPIGVFWDIENCAVPTGKSSLSIVQRVRERFFAGHKEAEFMCVCDINKESRHVIQDLNNAQVNVVHINATAKNAADDKLRQSIRRFAHNHPAPATLVLITGDSNFTSEVSDLRHRHKYFVVLIHPASASQSLIQAATTVICYEHLVADLPIVHVSPKTAPDSPQPQLLVSNLPLNNDANAVRTRLRQLSDNCGGKVLKLSMGTAVLKFATADAANRALKRLDGEDVFGHSIKVSVLHQSPSVPNAVRNGKQFQNNFPNFSPGRQFNSGYHNKQKNCAENFNIQDRPEFIQVSNEHSVKQTMNLTPGHCDPPANFPPPFQLLPNFSNGTPGQMMPPRGPPSFPMPPVLNPPPAHYILDRNSPIYRPTGYNPMPPPPPQPQLFQPPKPDRKPIDNQENGVKLTISNIDAQLGINSIQDCLLKQITDHCKILDMKVRPHNRFTVVCDVTVPHVRDASRVLQHLQRQKIGTKRVLVTLAQQNGEEFGSEEACCLKRDCYILLKDCAGRRMPLYRFFNLYEKRFEHKIRLEELRQIPDVVLFRDGSSGREIYINPKIKDETCLEQLIASYPRSGRSTPDINHDFLLPVCKLHYPSDAPRPPSGEKGGELLKIEMGLREFSAKLHALLHSHNGILQLDGFEYCYRAEYGSFPFPNDIEEGGVIVEHQASYVPGVQIITSQPHCLGVKAIVWAQPQSDTGSDTASDTSGATRWKSPNLIHFSREVVELLKDRAYCCLPYDKFNSTYQRTFGHACRVAEYGFTRLSDLLAAIPHVLQIMGSLSNRILTLTHRAQVKRFTQEVVKILKSTPDRAILVAQMPELYNRTFNRAWRLRDYGVSVLSDLLDDIPEGHICTTGEGDNIVLSLPIRERTHEEKERTNQFAREVVKILRARSHYCMPFTDFVPTYHRQYGRQCKLANYGFTKLIDLFEALPHVVQVLERGTEKLIALTDTEQQKILSIQITSILRAQIPPAITMMPNRGGGDNNHNKNNHDGPTLPLACVPALFQQKYGFPLVPHDFDANNINELMKKLSHAVKVVVNKAGDKMIKLAERKPLRLLSAQLLALLLDQTSDQLDVDHLHSMYTERYRENIDPSEYGFLSFGDIIRKALPGVVKMDLDSPECLHLKPLYNEARSIRSVLLKNNGTMTMGEFNFAYLTTFQRTVDFEKYGFPTFESLLRALPNVLIVKGFGAKRTLTLRNHMQFGPLTATSVVDKSNEKTIGGSASMDDLQAIEGSQSQSAAWVPKILPQCMMQYWRGSNAPKNQNHLVNSASMGDFKSEEENRRREKMGSERSGPNWLPPSRPTVPLYSGSSFQFQYSKPRLPHPMNTFTKPRQYKSPVNTHSACNFTIRGSDSTDNNLESKENRETPARRGISVSVITLPNGSTPIASTSSCSSASTPKSYRSSKSSTDYSEEGSCSSDESCPSQNVISSNDFPRISSNGVSSLPNSPFTRITATAYVGTLPSMRNNNGHPASDHGSPGRIQLAASFTTLTHT